jgi:TonB family protein
MYFQGLSISILFHAILIFSLAALETSDKNDSRQEEIVEIEYIELSGNLRVTEALAPNLDLLNQSQTNLTSKSYQRVEEQSVAKYIGKTENRSHKKSISPELLPPLSSKKSGSGFLDKETSDNTADKGSEVFDQVKKEEVYDNLFDKLGTSKIQDRVYDDIKYGNFTALNTNRNQFYSFYERIDEQIRIRWYENIEQQIANLKSTKPNHKFTRGERLSQIDLVLNAKGEIINSYISRSSGEKNWDMAAMMALRKSAPFINPPKEMIESDGNIRIKYSFSLQLH